MSELLSSITGGGGGVFTPDGGMISELIASGQTGLLLNVPAASNRFYKITTISVGDTGGNQPGISLVINGSTIHSEVVLDDQQPTGLAASGTAFIVSQQYGSSNLENPRQYSHIICKSFSLSKNAGNTIRPIQVVYEIGSIE